MSQAPADDDSSPRAVGIERYLLRGCPLFGKQLLFIHEHRRGRDVLLFVRVRSGGVLVCPLEGAHRILLVTADGDGPAATWELDDVVRMVGNQHEFGEGRVAENGKKSSYQWVCVWKI